MTVNLERKRAYWKVWYSKNKDVIAKKKHDYRLAHPEEARAIVRRSRTKEEHRRHIREYNKRWLEQAKEKDPLRYRRIYLKQRYGISHEEFEDAVAAQNGVCAICGCPPDGRFGVLVIDHDHKTGAVRQLLCTSCNRGLGVFKDDPQKLYRAAEYLARWNETQKKTNEGERGNE